jgi:hypothetical protein
MDAIGEEGAKEKSIAAYNNPSFQHQAQGRVLASKTTKLVI